MTADWIARQIMLVRRVEKANRLRFNPNPKGVMKPEGCAMVLYQLFVGNPHRFFTRAQLVEAAKQFEKSAEAVDWAIIFLRSSRVIEAVTDSRRNSRYNRYRLNPSFFAHENPYTDQGPSKQGSEDKQK